MFTVSSIQAWIYSESIVSSDAVLIIEFFFWAEGAEEPCRPFHLIFNFISVISFWFSFIVCLNSFFLLYDISYLSVVRPKKIEFIHINLFSTGDTVLVYFVQT